MAITPNAPAFFVLSSQDGTNQVEMAVGKTKITLVFDNAAENPELLKSIENILTASCDLSDGKMSA